MNNDIIKVFNEGKDSDLPLEDIRGGWCIGNATCATGNDSKCNVNKCNPDKIKTDPTIPSGPVTQE